ncbi:hypothetical protein [Caballeronia novacaledonica]|uniref:SGNH hydrolase-type esterase domain-containing protein n=1 Tax=Caballeronia novacaledonica TaxID=1544861 RepID=A0AA37MUF3_9BURK|nr:hypothetical protein [Caballeronia novacaledonica]GJH29292.1 hypothetical protein CBA19CS42_32270 [Caballeronia novacaledonica]
MAKLNIFSSLLVNSKNEPGWGGYNWQFLAQGDSWFSTSTIQGRRSNLLENLDFPQAAAVVNCATPGDELTHMVDVRRDPLFNSLLCGPKQQPWNAIFLSGGGNDLIDFVKIAPTDEHGSFVVPHDRALLTSSEWGGGSADADSRYISKDGWANFENHMALQYRAIDALRKQSRDNQNTPIFTHTYDYATARNSGAGPGIGPWLYPSLRSYGIPPEDWDELVDTFMDKLFSIIKGAEQLLTNFHVIDTRGALDRAKDGDTGISGDWQNEIHATANGYVKIGLRFAPRVSEVLSIQPLGDGAGAIPQAVVAAQKPGGGAGATGARP